MTVKELIEALQKQDPDRVVICQKDAHVRIGEIFDALECQNSEVEKLRSAIRNFRDVSGRHHTQIACERLLALLPENNGNT